MALERIADELARIRSQRDKGAPFTLTQDVLGDLLRGIVRRR